MDFKKGAADGREEMKDDGFPSDHRPGADGGCLGDARDLMSDRANATAGTVLAVRPRVLQVEITSHCNLKCVMCPLTLGATLWEQVVKAAREVGRVNLTGFGENATNAKFPALLEELDALGI